MEILLITLVLCLVFCFLDLFISKITKNKREAAAAELFKKRLSDNGLDADFISKLHDLMSI